MNPGRLIVFEGIDGCGKTTQLTMAREYLQEKGIPVITSREPGGTSIGEAIRHVLLVPDHAAMDWRTELLLYIASRAQHAAQVVLPALERGEWVLLDRYGDSSLAYQGYGRGLPLEWIRRLNAFAMQDRSPDLVLYLDLPVETALGRCRSARREPDRIEAETVEFYRRVAAGYRELAAGGPPYVKIDGDRPPQVIAADIKSLLQFLK